MGEALDLAAKIGVQSNKTFCAFVQYLFPKMGNLISVKGFKTKERSSKMLNCKQKDNLSDMKPYNQCESEYWKKISYKVGILTSGSFASGMPGRSCGTKCIQTLRSCNIK